MEICVFDAGDKEHNNVLLDDLLFIVLYLLLSSFIYF